MRCTYSRPQIESLMPAVWDTMRALEGPRETSRDAELQGFKGTVDPRRSNDRLTECADIQRAWALAGLTLRQKQVLYLRFAWDDLIEDIGNTLGISQQAASVHLDKGLARIEALLNGAEEVAA